MKTLETTRLLLRKFTREDFPAAHSYGSRADNTIYMQWGPNSEEQTWDFINRSIALAEEEPVTNYQYAVVQKESGKMIGACNLRTMGDEDEVGWILHSDYWKKGYGAELGAALLDYGFGELGLRRIIARCDAENYGSYRVMEKIGMRREGLYLDARPANKLSVRKYGDELSYAILRDEWEVAGEIRYYNALPVEFNGFTDVPALSDGELYLVCTSKFPPNEERNLVPAYDFAVCKNGEKIGDINLRIGYSERLYYGGQIGYNIDEKHRGNGYAGSACRLLLPIARAHKMEKLIITNNQTNTASRRVCEKLGAKFIRVARIPEWHDLYEPDVRWNNIFELSVN